MELLISSSMKQRLMEASIEEAEVRRVFAAEGGVIDPASGAVVKGGRVGAVTLWLESSPAENGYCLESFYFHRIAVEGVALCPEN